MKLSLGVVAAGCVIAAAPLAHAGSDIAALRARGPAALDELLARYDALPAGPDKAELADTIDAVAGQKYATVSRLYWYTELDRAEDAAKQLGRPILALRMLGDLREDLSCANSRLFRSTLYANRAVSQFLRSHFVLYWSSERAVPKVTIDFGDGRKIVRTTTGNSIHYVLDADGRVLDALPGLYAPAVFARELTKSLALAAKVAHLPEAARTKVIAQYHANALAASQRAWEEMRTTDYIRGARRLLRPGELTSALASAQRATISKAFVEVPDLAKVGALAPSDLAADDAAAWATIGQKLYFGLAPATAVAKQAARPAPAAPPVVLDPASRALVEELWGGAEGFAPMLQRLEQHIVADTALNELSLRSQIHQRLADGAADLDALNAWVYDVVFHTPKSDPWLGLHARTDFTGLPGDGVVMP